MDESDAFLVARAIRRDREAFSQLYDRYVDRIYRFIRIRVGNKEDADDLTSVVFFNAWRTIDHFSPKHDGSFLAWLFTLARHVVVDRYRRDREVMSLDAMGIHRADEAMVSPEDDLDSRLTIMALHQALRLLTSEQRDVVLLRFIEGLSARQVGIILGKQEGTVRGMQFRAIEAIRRALHLVREGDTLD
ncbi:MAG TPA: sigma-70 family RNA polymerase sigma factor [Ktedonobacterales bacterium]